MSDLISRTALVTGASRGIGRATARALAAAGARVIVHYGNAAAEAEALVKEIRADGGRADAVAADLSAPDGAHKLAVEVRKLVVGQLDILVANAGIATAAAIEDQSVEEFDRMFAVNVRAPFFLVQQLLPLFGEGSSIVLLSSLAARASVGLLPAYAATKGAIDTLVKHFAVLLRPRRIPAGSGSTSRRKGFRCQSCRSISPRGNSSPRPTPPPTRAAWFRRWCWTTAPRSAKCPRSCATWRRSNPSRRCSARRRRRRRWLRCGNAAPNWRDLLP